MRLHSVRLCFPASACRQVDRSRSRIVPGVDVSFFASKILWAVAAPGNLLALAVVVSALLSLFRNRRARAAGRLLLLPAAAAFLAAAFLPVGQWALHPLEERFPGRAPPEDVDGIIVLGGMVDQVVAASRGVPALTSSAERLMEAADLARRYPGAKLVVSGGSGLLAEQEIKEAPVMVEALRRLGIASDRIVTEDRSRNTYENALFSRDLVRPAEGETWLLVTSAFHMPRSVGIFRRLGWPVVPWPVDYRTLARPHLRDVNVVGNLVDLHIATREWIGLLAYFRMGRTDTLFPGP
jgi:uncharacterized SAM-binding protein YcdF (DUF218 family)